jgi:membrane protein
MTSLWTRAGLSWRQLGLRLWRQIWEDELLGRCAELAYFFLFSIFPLLLFLTTLLGYISEANPTLQWDLFAYVARVSPSGEVTALLNNTLAEIRAARTGVKLYLSLATAVWVASNGILAVSRTLNTACGLKETRPWWKKRIMAVVLTLTFAVLILCALALIFYGAQLGSAVADRLGVGALFKVAWHLIIWPLVLIFVFISFEVVYNYAPNLGDTPNRQWGTPGAVTGVSLWLLASFGLRFYLAYFHSYTTAYGSLGAVILLLVWFYLTAFAILMGGEVNSEIARELALQRGEPRPRLTRRRRLLNRIRRRRQGRL